MPSANDFVKFKDLPDFRNFLLDTGTIDADTLGGIAASQFVRNDVASQSVLSPFTITGTSSVLNLVDTNGEDAALTLDGDILTQSVNSVSYIRLRGGANDDIQLDRPVTAGSSLTVTGATIFNGTTEFNSSAQFDGAVTFNSTVSGLTFTDLTLSDATPTITFTDTTASQDDYTIAVEASLMTITNTVTGDSMVFGDTALLLNLLPTDNSQIAFRCSMDNVTSGSIPAIQVTQGGGGSSYFRVSAAGEVRTSSGYPNSMSDVPTGTNVTLGGQYLQDTSDGGNVGGGEDTIASHTIDGNALAQDGDTFHFFFAGEFAANANNKQLRMYVDGNAVVDSGAVAFNGLKWAIQGDIIRVDSSSVKTCIIFSVGQTGVGNSRFETYAGSLSGVLDLTNAFAISVTGAGTSNNDIVCSCSAIRKFARGT